MNNFNEDAFRAKVNQAVEKVKTILDNSKLPQYAATDVKHEYDDKYILAEFMTTTAVAATLNVLSNLGCSTKTLDKLREWNKTRSVTLRLKAEEKCKFLRKVEREVESDTKHVSTSTVFGKSTSYTVTKVTEYFWQFDMTYALVAYQGTDSDHGEVLQTRSGSVELKTSSDSTPKPVSVVRPNIDINISWFLNHLDEKGNAKFNIDRTAAKCRTPRRNPDVDGVFTFFHSFHNWNANVQSYFTNTLFPVQTDHGLDLNNMSKENGLFVPVLPLFDEAALKEKTGLIKKKKNDKGEEKEEPLTTPVPLSYIKFFLDEQARSLNEKFTELNKVYPANSKLITATDAKLVLLTYHARSICVYLGDGIDHIEDMLRKQIIAAIGKIVGPVEFTAYMKFHHRKLFQGPYQPQGFSYAIRRPDHYPEGTLTIEAQQADGSLADPIQTIVSSTKAARPMKFALDASTNVSFLGDRYLHGFINTQFSGSSGQSLSLTARARQFSSFILLVGRIASAEVFEPKYGIIVQNKDEFKLPLNLETIPTPKEFRDAIESLSPEQQRFAKAFRSMQLESTLFGVAVIQIKPALEKVLKLPNDSLTKEIALSEDLLKLFIEYQIPSDLISYDGSDGNAVRTKIDTVRGYVSNMQKLIKDSKSTQLKEAQEKQSYRFAENDYLAASPPPPPMPSLSYSSAVSYNSAPPPMPSFSAMPMPAPPPPGAGAPPPGAGGPPPQARGPMPQSAPRVSAPAPAPAPAPSIQPKPAQPVQSAQPQQQFKDDDKTLAVQQEGESIDYTKIPTQLEAKFDELDKDGALRPTIINPGNTWTKKYQKSLLSEPATTTLSTEDQGKERNKAFDLLDALTKSGSLLVDAAELHVVIAATHCFDKNLMDTLVKDNVNPIEKVERSSLIIASTIHGLDPKDLVVPEQIERVRTYSPMLIADVEANPAPKIGAVAETVKK